MPTFEPGTVWLVGSGPGDPALLTVAAIHALQCADVIVHDALVSEAVLALAAPGATREFAGKRGGRPSALQPDITRRLIELAREGRRVLRLKGGDPFVFGRGVEEAMALGEAGIAFHVVSGITAGIGGLASAGIPLTSRMTNHGVIFLTGHLASAEGMAIDWKAIVNSRLPVVFYMAMAVLEEIAGGLLGAGMAPLTPAAAVARASLPDQRVLVTTLGRLVEDVQRANLATPAIVAVGSIVSLRSVLAPSVP
ncbi:uroporphyrinogen-III C-methyltransferase [Ancylobacter mangrovi]|uniref:uroporphyrinogen-III C-methyltransferase n=1 Tax=Ancylobacter mangrovi TaxID=2972472 RepID=UPI002161F603|nr:uroporphyrinogen-III C-methyltransferase [Ancylobacter mangrovi]MCS0502918.1 uroporphyrinogen-III C-methyltransferase [Ancylobacter mangrovi]